MRDINEDGLCQIKDKSPELSQENEVVFNIFDQAFGTANCIEGADKNIYYVKPTDVEALMNIHNVDTDSKSEIMRRVLILQGISNKERPNRPKVRGR